MLDETMQVPQSGYLESLSRTEPLNLQENLVIPDLMLIVFAWRLQRLAVACRKIV